jgi:hypothetical protein
MPLVLLSLVQLAVVSPSPFHLPVEMTAGRPVEPVEPVETPGFRGEGWLAVLGESRGIAAAEEVG